MTSPGDFTPYSTLRPMFPSSLPSWVPDELDKQRIESYKLYEQIYWGVPETFKLVARGTEDKPIYLPNAKTIIETAHRFTATNMTVVINPTLVDPAIDADRVAYQAVWDDLFKRERFWSKFQGNKRYGLIRGDWCWYIIADPLKPPGSRLSIRQLDPASYFPIWDPNDIDKIVGCHIVDQVINDKGDPEINRTTFRKPLTELNPGQFITKEQAVFETDDWGGPKSKPIRVISPPTPINGITSLPVYHLRNFDEPANPFGSSELRGVERIFAAINQGISDEELALALEGLGVYTTDAPPPTDDDGNVLNWILGPGRVVEHPTGTTFGRVSGVSSVQSSQDHLNFLIKNLKEATSIPDVAIGNVDVSVAQSGVALALQFAPIIAHTAEKDTSIVEVHQQMFYDIQTQWLPTFEGIHGDGMLVDPVVGDKIPQDRDARLTELNNMFDRGIISAEYYRSEAAKIGFVFPENIEKQIADETATRAAAADPFGQRTADELAAGGGDTSGQGQTVQGDTQG